MDAVKTGRFIADLRRERGLTQQQLADRLCVSYKAVSRWETGRGTPDLDNLEALSKELGVSIAELLRGERLVESITVKDADGLARDSVLLMRTLVRKRAVGNVAAGFIIGLTVVLLVVINLTSPNTIAYHDGLITVETTEDGVLLASIENGVTGCEVNYAIDSDTGETMAYVSCYSKLWSVLTGSTDLGWHIPGMRCAIAIGTNDDIACVYYYPGEERTPYWPIVQRADWSRNAMLYARAGFDGFDTITQPRHVYGGIVLVSLTAGAVGLIVFAILRKRRCAPLVLLIALLPLCLAVAAIAVLWGRIDHVFDASFYVSGTALLTLALFACAYLAVFYGRGDRRGGDFASSSLARKAKIMVGAASVSVIVVISACAVLASSDTCFRNRTIFVPTDEFILENGYPVNAAGQTYGAPVYESDLELGRPDLMLARGVGGVMGYLNLEESGGPTFTDPDEAADYSRSRPRTIYYPLYDRDGITVVGFFRNGPAGLF